VPVKDVCMPLPALQVGVQRVLSLTIIIVLLLLSSAGCGGTASTGKVTHPLDGEWLVTSLNGKRLPADAEVTVVYHGECGCTSVDTHQNKELASAIDSSNWRSRNHLFRRRRGRRNRSSSLFRRGSTNRDIR